MRSVVIVSDFVEGDSLPPPSFVHSSPSKTHMILSFPLPSVYFKGSATSHGLARPHQRTGLRVIYAERWPITVAKLRTPLSGFPLTCVQFRSANGRRGDGRPCRDARSHP